MRKIANQQDIASEAFYGMNDEDFAVALKEIVGDHCWLEAVFWQTRARYLAEQGRKS